MTAPVLRRIPILAALVVAVFCAALLPTEATARPVRGRIFKIVPWNPLKPFPLPVIVPKPELPGKPFKPATPAQPTRPRNIVNPSLDNGPAVRQVSHKQPLREGIADLPDDAHKCHLTVFLNYNGTSRDQQLVNFIQSDRELAAIAAQCHVQYIYKGDPKDSTFEAKYGAVIQQVPAVWLVQADEKLVFKASGNNIPATAKGLRDKLKAAIQKLKDKIKPRSKVNPKKVASVALPDSKAGVLANVVVSTKPEAKSGAYVPSRPCPNPGPAPTPVAPPYIVNPSLPDTVEVDVVEDEEESDDKGLYAVLVVAGGLAFVVSVAFSMYKKINE